MFNFLKMSKNYTKVFKVYSLQKFTNPFTGTEHFLKNHVYTGIVYDSISKKTENYPVFENKYINYIKTIDQLNNFYSRNRLKGDEFNVIIPLKIEEHVIEGDVYTFGNVFGDSKKEVIKHYCKLRLISLSQLLVIFGLTCCLFYYLDNVSRVCPDKHMNFI